MRRLVRTVRSASADHDARMILAALINLIFAQRIDVDYRVIAHVSIEVGAFFLWTQWVLYEKPTLLWVVVTGAVVVESYFWIKLACGVLE